MTMDDATKRALAPRPDPWAPSAEPEDGPLAVAAAAGRAAWRRRWPLATWVTLCVLAGAGYARSVPPTFTATATILLDPRQQFTGRGDVAALATQQPVLDAAQAEGQIQVIRSERLLARVFDGLGLADSPELAPGPPGPVARLRSAVEGLVGVAPGREPTADEARQLAFANFSSRVTARRVGQSYVVEVSYASGDPTQARRVANATVSAYLGQSVTFKADAARNGAEFLQFRVTSLVAQANAAEAAVTAGTLPETPTPDADAKVIGAALQPLGRSAPRTGLIVAFAGAFGLMAGLLALALADALDRRVRSPEAMRRETGLPCLGVVPDAGRRRRNGPDVLSLATTDPDGAFAAAVRDLRTSLSGRGARQRRGEPGRVVALASWGPDVGCTTLCANLARVVAASGHRVTMVDADVHRATPGLSGSLSVAAGLVEALLGAASPDAIEVRDLDGVSLVPARASGRERAQNAYLGAPEMDEVLEVARARGDVFVDLPPLDRTGDARAAAARADAVVIVAAAGRTTRDDVARAMTALEGAGANVVGVVINRARA